MKKYDRPAIYQGKNQRQDPQFDLKFGQGSRDTFEPAIQKHKTTIKPVLNGHRLLQGQGPSGQKNEAYQIPFVHQKQMEERIAPTEALGQAPGDQDSLISPSILSKAKHRQRKYTNFIEAAKPGPKPEAVPFLKKEGARTWDGHTANEDYTGPVQGQLFEANMLQSDSKVQSAKSGIKQADKTQPASPPSSYKPAFEATKPLVQESLFDDQLNINEKLLKDQHLRIDRPLYDIRSISKRMIKSKDSFLLFENEEG